MVLDIIKYNDFNYGKLRQKNIDVKKDDFKQLNKFSLAEGLGMGYGAIGGALSGAMIATAIAKKKKLNEHKSRLIGALIGSVPGVALGYVGGRLTKGNMFIKSGNEMMPDSYKKLKIRLE
jgi:hypothetical protein